MNYTQTELEGMSDDELNEKATKLKYNGYYAYYCPCNNWNDCGALIDNLCAERTVLSQGTSVHGEYVGYTYGDKSLLVDQPHKRAVTIVYILIKQGKK